MKSKLELEHIVGVSFGALFVLTGLYVLEQLTVVSQALVKQRILAVAAIAILIGAVFFYAIISDL